MCDDRCGAADNLVENHVIAAGLGDTPTGPYSHYFAKTKRAEFLAHHHEVTIGEVAQYLTLF